MFIVLFMMKILDYVPMEMSKQLLHHYMGHVMLHDLPLIVVSIYTEQLVILNDVIIYAITKQALVFMKQTVEDFVLRMGLIVLLPMDHMT